MIDIEKKHTTAGTFLNISIDTGQGVVTVYGCQRMTGTSAKGAYDFISTPSRKGFDKDRNVKYWSIVKFSPEMNATILDNLDKGDKKHSINSDNVPF